MDKRGTKKGRSLNLIVQLLVTYAYVLASTILYSVVFDVCLGSQCVDSISTGNALILGTFVTSPIFTAELILLHLICKLFKIPCNVLASFIPVLIFVVSLFIIYDINVSLFCRFHDGSLFVEENVGQFKMWVNKRWSYDWIFCIISFMVSSMITVLSSCMLRHRHKKSPQKFCQFKKKS